MQVSDPNYPGFALPIVIDPPDSLCFVVKVPNDIHHVAAFFGSLYELTQWTSWQRDAGKHGKDAAAIWRDIWTDLQAQSCDLKPTGPTGLEIEDFMPLRVDCDCNVFVTCCDGTEKQILTSEQVTKLIGGQPGDGTPQPVPGVSSCYHALLNANSSWLFPAPVNTGDVITINNASGAVSNSDTDNWHCPDGSTFFAGACIAVTLIDAANPVPAAPTSSIIIKIGANYYSTLPGVPFTVPAGVVNIQPTFQVNDDLISGLSGTFQFDACITAGTPPPPGTWQVDFDFVASIDHFEAVPFACAFSTEWGAIWHAGSGWGNDPSASPFDFCVIRNNGSIAPTGSWTDVWITTDCNVGGETLDIRYASTIHPCTNSDVLLEQFQAQTLGTHIYHFVPTVAGILGCAIRNGNSSSRVTHVRIAGTNP